MHMVRDRVRVRCKDLGPPFPNPNPNSRQTSGMASRYQVPDLPTLINF